MTALFLTDPKDDREQLIQAKGSRVDSTCEWIKSNAVYESWLHSRSQLLWLSGGPGKGKTMLSIFLAEELEQVAKHSEDVLFLQYFCDNKDEKRNTAVAVLRGLILQLLQSQRKLLDHILPSFKIQKKSLFTDRSFQGLWRIFENMVRDPILGTVYCVLDGLDECDETSLKILLERLAALLSSETNESPVCHLNLIVLSRDLPDLFPKLLSNFPRIRLDLDADSEINNDIYYFIEKKVDELSVYGQYPEPLRVHVKKVFQSRAQGTFLWVGIVAKELEKYKATQVEQALNSFPPGLDELYARMLLQIDSKQREIAAKILRWVVMAVRPLTLSELSVVLDITVEPDGAFSLDEVIRDQVSCCGYLITLTKVEVGFEDEVGLKDEVSLKDEIRLLHQSTKDYLLRQTRDSNPELEIFRVNEEAVNLEIARECLNYLEKGALAKGKIDLETDISHMRAFPLLSYAALHWFEHGRSLARSENIFDTSRRFYNQKHLIWRSWLKTYVTSIDGGHTLEWWNSVLDSFSLLHLASYHGILPLANNLLIKEGLLDKLKRVNSLNHTDNAGRTALMWASINGHEGVARLLLEKKADVNKKDPSGKTALMRASSNGHEGVARLLLEKKADVNKKDPSGRTALYYGVIYGHGAMARLLLEKRANVDIKNKNGKTVLNFAVKIGHEPMVRLFLTYGANIETRDIYDKTPLYRAAQNGHENVVRVLLESGADINARNGFLENTTALHKAAAEGLETVVQLLLEKGGDLKLKDYEGRTAIDAAANKGHKAVVRLLLKNETDVDIIHFYEKKVRDGLRRIFEENERRAADWVERNKEALNSVGRS